jgi:hypothetical protein
MIGINFAVIRMCLLGNIMTLSVIDVQADSINAGVYSVNEKPYGLTYGDWTPKWW